MTWMRKCFGCILLCAIVVLASCSNEIPENKPGVRKGRTVLAYLVANNNLDSYLEDNVEWMYQALSAMTDTCTLLVYYRPVPDDRTFEGPTLMEFVCEGNGYVNGVPALSGATVTFDNVVEQARKKVYPDDGSYVAVDPMTMRQVLLEMQEIAPSDSYGLIFGSHATSWLEGNSVQSKSFGDDNGYNIDIPVMASILASCFPQKLDFILFDACMMGTAEVAYELRNVTDYMIGSVMETPVYGFPYRQILSKLYDDVSVFPQICDDFISFNKERKQWGTCALVDCSKMEEFADAVGRGLETYASELRGLDYEAVQQYGIYHSKRIDYQYFSFDVGDFFCSLNGGQIPESIQSALDETVVAKSCLSGSDYEFGGVIVDGNRFCGIGMYYPDQGIKDTWDEYYRTSIAWYRAAGWERFVPALSY